MDLTATLIKLVVSFKTVTPKKYSLCSDSKQQKTNIFLKTAAESLSTLDMTPHTVVFMFCVI